MPPLTVPWPSPGRVVLVREVAERYDETWPAVVIEVDDADPKLIRVRVLGDEDAMTWSLLWVFFDPGLSGRRTWCYPPREDRTMEVR